MKILFVGQNPSKHNVDLDDPFVGSRSYGTLLSWLKELSLRPSDIFMINASNKIGRVCLKDADLKVMFHFCCSHEKIVLLGKYAERCYDKLCSVYGWDKGTAFVLPHPSGLNRKVNDKKFLSEELRKCKRYLND